MEKLFYEMEQFTERFHQRLLADIKSTMEEVFSRKVKQTDPNEIVWLSSRDAHQLLGLKSRKSFKQLRDRGEVHYAKVGKEYRYDKKSLNDYILHRSTLRYSIGIKKRKPLY